MAGGGSLRGEYGEDLLCNINREITIFVVITMCTTMRQPETLLVEHHPLEPFLPAGARVLMLGSFPPPHARWSMEFFYPNWINDMWRIMGVIFFDDPHHFEISGERRFDQERVVEFCEKEGIAIYDTATEVRRLMNNASDKYLEVVTPTDLVSLLAQIPSCRDVVTTGQKATDVATLCFGCSEPAVGDYSEFVLGDRAMRLWRMPSSSRAYPLPIAKKAEYYRRLFSLTLSR